MNSSFSFFKATPPTFDAVTLFDERDSAVSDDDGVGVCNPPNVPLLVENPCELDEAVADDATDEATDTADEAAAEAAVDATDAAEEAADTADRAVAVADKENEL